ncbi:MAG: hypothetical protein GTN78_25495, partial [Gemmatimonadales bacterium]|nr:hypothetical protein [Gemmatimonadales bacterium]NIN12403.1 hypothetical protein [Gemmatimonadales bacterium]NIR03511.1 hypothetical protein [Gemmatimonadales bacterium]NIS67113.1 hypothetical protein [Gemmatimonadales bacterium]
MRIFFDDVAEAWVDPFLTKLADDLVGTQLDLNNTWLTDSIRARATSNIA